jgi:hypothetical protein
MTISVEELYDRALALSSDVEDKFLELGRSLRQLLDRDPALFQQVVKKRLGVGKRTIWSKLAGGSSLCRSAERDSRRSGGPSSRSSAST